jgi:amino acid transporter
MVGLVFVGACIATLAKRHPEAGSYFVYIGRNFGPMTGALAGWPMILAYITTAVAVVFGFPIFLGNFDAAFKIAFSFPLLVVFAVAFLGLVAYAAYRDIQVSSRVGLVMETIWIGIIITTAIVVGKHGTVVDTTQIDVSHLKFGGVVPAPDLRGLQLRGFQKCRDAGEGFLQSAAQLPIAIIGSTAVGGLLLHQPIAWSWA